MDGQRIKYRCSFCNKHQSQEDRLFAGPGGVFICDECVAICSEIVTEQRGASKHTKQVPRAWLRFWRR